MSEPVKPEALLPAEYILGLLRGPERRAAEQRLEADPALRAQVEYWQEMFSPLQTEDSEPTPVGLFEKILDRIDADGLQLPGTVTRRGATATWQQISPGIRGRVLHVDRANNRQYLVIRMEPGAVYLPHAHHIDEHTLVLEGDLMFGDLELHAGDFHLASAASTHPPGRTVGGCLVHVVASLD
jgi:anti-sigma factor ChrR (cupin superfamily)